MKVSPAIPLTGWAQAQLAKIAALTKRELPEAATLLGERAALNRLQIPGRVSAGGGCRFYDTADGAVALSLARSDDRALLPALFGEVFDPGDDKAIAARMARAASAAIVARGRELGLALAGLDETPSSPALAVTAQGPAAAPRPGPPLVLDLSALWAGPLATHLLQLCGATVLKVESRNRPDAMREGDPALFARLNGGKASVALDLRDAADRAALVALIRRADMVVEAARPRALRQLGIDADRLVAEVPGLVWVTITGHGLARTAANWVGFGDDCGVAGGSSAALRNASGTTGFVGDAIADPLSGIFAARALARQRARERGARLVVAMSAVVAEALAAERARDPAALASDLKRWAATVGAPFPAVAERAAGPVAPLGADNGRWLEMTQPC